MLSMAASFLFIIAFLALIVWRFAFTGPPPWPLVRAIVPWPHRHNNVLEGGLHIPGPGGVAGIAGNRFEDSSDSLNPIDRRDRAKAYLRPIVALTDATQINHEYFLNARPTRFPLPDRNSRRSQ